MTCLHLNNVSRPELGPGTAKNPLWRATGPGAPSSNLQISHQRINQSGWESDPQGFQGLSHLSRKSATGATGMLSHQKLSGRCPKRPALRPIAARSPARLSDSRDTSPGRVRVSRDPPMPNTATRGVSGDDPMHPTWPRCIPEHPVGCPEVPRGPRNGPRLSGDPQRVIPRSGDDPRPSSDPQAHCYRPWMAI